jgi:hypothetical protein
LGETRKPQTFLRLSVIRPATIPTLSAFRRIGRDFAHCVRSTYFPTLVVTGGLCIQESPRYSLRLSVIRQATTYSPTISSTIGADGLNFSVRNGKRWNPAAIVTLRCLTQDTVTGIRYPVSGRFLILLTYWLCRDRFDICPYR